MLKMKGVAMSKYIGAYEALAKTFTNSSGVNLICKGSGFMTDGKTIIIPEIPDKLNKELRDPALSGILHESQHIVHSEFKKRNPKKHKTLLAARGLWNNLEDIRIYELGKKTYRGYQSLQETGLNYIRDHILIPNMSGGPVDSIDNFTLLGACIHYRLSSVSDSFFPKEIRELADLVEDDVRNTVWLPTEKGQHQSEELTLEIIKKLKLKAEEEEEKEKEEEEEKEKEEEEDGNGGGGSGQGDDLKDDWEDDCEDAEWEKENNKDPDSTSHGEGQIDVSSNKKRKKQPITGDIHSGARHIVQELEENEEEIEEENSDDLEDKGIMKLLEDAISKVVEAHNTDNDRHMPHPEIIPYDVEETIQEYAPARCNDKKRMKSELAAITESIDKQTKILKAKMLPLLLAEKKSSFLVDQDEGEIDGSRIYKIPDGGTSVYRKKVPGRKVDTAISILCDISGSMCGSPIDMLKQTLVVISDALMALKIPFEILAFTTQSKPYDGHGNIRNQKAFDVIKKIENERWNGSHNTSIYNRFYPTRHVIIKSFNENYLNMREFIPAMDAEESNIDGEALEWSLKRLSLQRQQRKIQIILSDGRPACSYADDTLLEKDLREKAYKAEKAGIEVIGIGILTDYPKKFYPTAVHIEKIEEMSSKIYEALLQKIKN